ncbi:U3 small nucleolar RNA-associated protein 14 like protein A [Habropoda laboriosa]|uniref:U3 small nucleolar RNA-associated protein 14 like protein A n=2 Tax=Habropoda laboriosa TaxID=597456 RepID=A0A0L7QZH5_9HYME|nr:U3 small nucleolar RNA-associated protein 14 like protein A [Habropoda laboriosa]
MQNYSDEILDDTEQNVSKFHFKLLDAVSQLDKGQRINKVERSEPTLEVSEFHLVKSGISNKDAVKVQDLAKALGKKSHYLDITRSLDSTKKKIHVLPKPLEKPAADQIKRVVGFKNAKEELKKWNAVITKNRIAESLHFPLNQSSVQFEQSTEFVKRFRLQSDLEKELAALEPQKENIEQKNDEFSLTLQEIVMKRKEAAKIRAQQSYKEAKARRQNKIKSKKFHRIQKKEKIKLQLKEFEELQKTDPQAALEKLELLDKSRAEERISLRHKNTGKWAKSKQIRAKYDKETRQELAQQLSVSRELTQKLKKVSDSEEEGEDVRSSVQLFVNDKENPWMGSAKTASEINDFIKSYRKYWDNQNNLLKNEQLNDNANNKIEIKQRKTLSGDTNPPNVLNDHNTDTNVDLFELQNNGKIPDIKTDFNKEIISSADLKSVSVSKDKEDVVTAKSVVKNVNNVLCNSIAKKTVSNNNRKSNKNVKLQKKNLNNITATSSWNVELVENTNVQHVINSLTFNSPNSEKIDKIFNFMEEKIQDQIKSKLEHVTQNYGRIKKKRKSKYLIFKEDNFDGLEIQAKKQKPILNSSLTESVNEYSSELNNELKNTEYVKYDNTLFTHKLNSSKIEIDPSKYINVKPKQLNTDLPVDITDGDEVLDDNEDEEERRNIVSEAFADDDVVEEFRKEKEEKAQESQPKDIDLTLPGWGAWGGKNIKVPKHKRRRFIMKVPKHLPCKDENKSNVIIFEDDNAKIKEHQVNELPHPFKSVKDYEASIRMPIGRNFIPENSHRKLIEPTVKTRMGKIIEPMNDDVLINKKEKRRPKCIFKKNKIIKEKKVK